jgi:hypothetical protein
MITVFFHPGTLSRLYFPRSKEVHLDYSTYAANLIISCSRALPFATIFSQYYSEKKFLFRISLGSSSACAFFVSRRVAHQKRICDDLISKRPAQAEGRERHASCMELTLIRFSSRKKL